MSKIKDELFKEVFLINSSIEEDLLLTCIKLIGADKCKEYIANYINITSKDKFSFYEFYDYINYEYDLARILFVILRIDEDLVKGFLSNIFKDLDINVERRDSRYSKDKYYLKFPDLINNSFIDIRTFNFEKGPVKIYDALKYLDFGDVNLIFSHLTKNYISKFSNNENIIEELDQTRKIRNFVYHHNILFSNGKDALKESIILMMRNLPSDSFKQFYINEIENLRYSSNDRNYEISDNLAIHFDEEDRKRIFEIKSKINS